MSQPIGREVGNATEVKESIAVLRGGGPADTRALTIALGAEMLLMGGAAASSDEGAAKIAAALDGGAALEKFREIVRAQSGDPRVCDDPDGVLPRAPVSTPLRARRAGVLSAVHAEAVGTAVVVLGGGRRKKEDGVDPAVGVTVNVRLGDAVREGDELAVVHHRGDAAAALALLGEAFVVGDDAPILPSLILEVLR